MTTTERVPWVPGPYQEQAELAYDGNIVIVSDGSHLVALVPPIDCIRDVNDVYCGEQTHATARLLRAAPELVEALESYMHSHRAVAHGENAPEAPDCQCYDCDRARALLARIREENVMKTNTCTHAPTEDCLICTDCGKCSESLNTRDLCASCEALRAPWRGYGPGKADGERRAEIRHQMSEAKRLK